MLCSGCTGFIPVETIKCVLDLNCRENEERERGGEEGWAASSVQMGIWSSGYTHMYACERQIEGRERGLCEREIGERRKGKCNSRLHVLVLQRGWACVGGRVWKRERERERERAVIEEREWRWWRFCPGSECMNWCVWHNVGSSCGNASKLKLKTKHWYKEVLLLKLREWWCNSVFTVSSTLHIS